MADLVEQSHNLFCRLGVKVACRLVGYDYLRMVEERTCYGYTLLLASREFMRQLHFLLLHSHSVQNEVNALVYLLRRLPSCGA